MCPSVDLSNQSAQDFLKETTEVDHNHCFWHYLKWNVALGQWPNFTSKTDNIYEDHEQMFVSAVMKYTPVILNFSFSCIKASVLWKRRKTFCFHDSSLAEVNFALSFLKIRGAPISELYVVVHVPILTIIKGYAFWMEDKMAAAAMGALGIVGETAPLSSLQTRLHGFKKFLSFFLFHLFLFL